MDKCNERLDAYFNCIRKHFNSYYCYDENCRKYFGKDSRILENEYRKILKLPDNIFKSTNGQNEQLLISIKNDIDKRKRRVIAIGITVMLIILLLTLIIPYYMVFIISFVCFSKREYRKCVYCK